MRNKRYLCSAVFLTACFAGQASEPASSGEIPVVKFTDITSKAGINFVHENGAFGEKLLPETMGGGAAFFDFDNDGNQDVVFINSGFWPGHIPRGKQQPT